MDLSLGKIDCKEVFYIIKLSLVIVIIDFILYQIY